MEEFVVKDGKKLRLGYTTGSCAAAASKAAAAMLLSGKIKNTIGIDTPKGIRLELPVEEISMEEGLVSCAIRKDSGDDPDVTKGALIFAKVSYSAKPGIHIDGGFGVGRVTKRGLDQPVGNAAINSVPRQMIKENAEEICRLYDYSGGLDIVIEVPLGEELAKKTFNPRLGIVGGISIIGTTGIVEPMSEAALVETIKVELRQRRAQGQEYVLLTPGNYGHDYIRDHMDLDPENAVIVSNFIGDAMEICKELGFKGFLLIGHIGKLVKLAGGMMNTHSKYGDCRMDIMTACSAACGLPKEACAQMLDCATCDDAVRILDEHGLREPVLAMISKRVDFILTTKAAGQLETGAYLFSKEYGMLGETAEAARLLSVLQKG